MRELPCKNLPRCDHLLVSKITKRHRKNGEKEFLFKNQNSDNQGQKSVGHLMQCSYFSVISMGCLMKQRVLFSFFL